jgi:hypothetical protein
MVLVAMGRGDALDKRSDDHHSGHAYFSSAYSMYKMLQRGLLSGTDMPVFAREIFDYLQLVDHLDDYLHEFLPTTFSAAPGLIDGSEQESSDGPLIREIDA